MSSRPSLQRTALAVAIASLAVASGAAQAGTYAPWLTQMGINDAVMSAARWGTGMTLGVVDTGIAANNPAFVAGQVSAALSGCAAVTFKCANGAVDDNSHGTAVAAIAAGSLTSPYNLSYDGYTTKIGNIMGVAPNANIVAEKVLNAAGSGYTTDVANGIKKAADAGVNVINVSITYANSSDIVGAINYAAAKGAFIVWAGGNSSQALMTGANTSGLTAQAIQHLLFAGSVNSANALSSFSNTPGAGALVDTSGNKTSYATRWAMAPGEAIVAPYATSGSTALAYWSGTSMAAPMLSGSLLLLESAWPILKTNGTAANLLLATATDLGAKGVDATYGNGLANLTTAFQPFGPLTVAKSNGQVVTVSSLTGALVTGGALGSLTAVQSLLSNYTSFDSYARNFSVNLSGLIATKPTAAVTNALPTNANTGVIKVKLADGGEASYLEATPANRAEILGVFGYNAELRSGQGAGYAMLTDKAGTTTAFGYGQSSQTAQYSYAVALYGSDDLAHMSSELGSASLADIAQGGGLFAYGTKLSDATRVAVSWSGSPVVTAATLASGANGPVDTANNLSVGLTHRFNNTVTGGVTLGMLREEHGMLGSAYDGNSAVSLGDTNRSYSLGFSAGFRLDSRSSLLLETAMATTRGNTGSGFLVGTSDVVARSWGATFMSRNLALADDRLTLSVKQPLRVSAGQVGVLTPSVDDQGLARYTTTWASLVPTGREIDYKLSYTAPLGKVRSLSFSAGYQRDALNVSGNNVAVAGWVFTQKF